jgi:hypothetical protein
MSENINVASREWASRPDDQRFLSLADLKESVGKRRRESWTVTPACSDLRVVPGQSDSLAVEVYDPTHGQTRELTPTNWSFSQLAGYAGAPAAYLRKIPSQLAAINLQWGLEHASQRDDALVLAQSNGDNKLRAMTSTSYGRIWDNQVVEAVERVNESGRWQVPSASYATTNPKRATTLYASDRDVFIFLVDPKNPIEVGGEQLFRGFYTWNSEVGSAVFGLTTFLYRYVCDNRIIWGATEIKELRIRHTGGAPERFAYEGGRYLAKYAEESTSAIAGQITAAKNKDLVQTLNTGKGETMESWLQSRGFTKAQAKASVETATAEQGQARSVWDIVNGITAYARSVPHTDERVTLEAKAGKLMELVS